MILRQDVLITDIGELWTCSGPAPLRGVSLSRLEPEEADAIAIAQGKVVEIGDTRELIERYPFDIYSADGRLVTPGLVDPHTHLPFVGHRGDEFVARCHGATYAQIAEAGGGIRSTVEVTRSAPLVEIVAAMLQRIFAATSTGTTTLEAKTGYGLDLESERKLLDAIQWISDKTPFDVVPTFMGGHAVPPGRDAVGYVKELVEKLIPMAAQHPAKPRFNDVFCDEGGFDLVQTRTILEAGQQFFMQPKVHAEEFVRTGASALAAEMGAISADHLLNVTEQDIEALARSETVAVLLPGTCFYLNLPKYAPARQMIEAGCTVALGTDFNPGSSNLSSMHFVMGLACLKMGLSPAEALGAATVNAAAAIGLHGSHGQLSPGYRGDLVIWEAFTLNELIGRFARPVDVEVFKGGALIYPNGEFMEAVFDRLTDWMQSR